MSVIHSWHFRCDCDQFPDGILSRQSGDSRMVLGVQSMPYSALAHILAETRVHPGGEVTRRMVATREARETLRVALA